MVFGRRKRSGSVLTQLFGQIFSVGPGYNNLCGCELSPVPRSEQEIIYDFVCVPVDCNVGGLWGHEEVSIMG